MPVSNTRVWNVETFQQPPAGAGFAITPTRAERWRLWSLMFTLATSAVVANRIVSLTLSDGSATLWRGQAPTAVPATQNVQYVAYDGGTPGTDAGGLVTLRWPRYGLNLRQGDTLTVAVAGIDVADQISAISAFVEEYPTGPWVDILPDQITTPEWIGG